MDDIKLFAKREKELVTLIKAKRIYSQDIGREFGIKMCYNNNVKQKTINDRRNRTTKSRKIGKLCEKETDKYLGILEALNIKQVEMKDKIKEYNSISKQRHKDQLSID